MVYGIVLYNTLEYRPLKNQTGQLPWVFVSRAQLPSWVDLLYDKVKSDSLCIYIRTIIITKHHLLKFHKKCALDGSGLMSLGPR